MLDIHVGAPVSCADGDAGEVYAVIIDPVKDTMTHIVVRGRERRHKTERLVPIAVIADATTDQVRLSCTLAELMAVDSFTQTHYIDHSGQQNYMMGQTSGQFIQPYTTDMRAVDDQIQVEIQAWHNMLMPGKRKPKVLPMHKHPFTLVRIVRYDEQGNPAFKNPLWLIVMGERRHELTLAQIHEAYACRFDLEHFFRFGKQKLLLDDFQTPDVEREENWWQLVHIAYAQLWMARHLADVLPNPWERNLPAMKRRLVSPTLVQRDFARIIRHLGTPAKPPKPRNISPGRRKGTKLPRRPCQKVVVKSQQAAKTA